MMNKTGIFRTVSEWLNVDAMTKNVMARIGAEWAGDVRPFCVQIAIESRDNDTQTVFCVAALVLLINPGDAEIGECVATYHVPPVWRGVDCDPLPQDQSGTLLPDASQIIFEEKIFWLNQRPIQAWKRTK